MPLKNSAGPLVGLDIGSTCIKACEIDCKGGRANLRGIAVIPTPPEAVANNEIVDPVALGKTIKQLLAQAGIKSKKVVSSVAGQSSLVVRIIEVPKMTRAELMETMKWEVERHVPFAAEQVVMDYQPLVAPEDVPEGQNMEVLLAVAQETLVNRHVEAIQAAGLTPVAIDLEPLAVSRSLLDLSNGAGPAGTVAVIDLGASSSDISIYREGRIAFTRAIQIAGNTLTKAISDVLGQPLADAERLKKELAMVPEAQQQGGGGFGDQFGGMPQLDFGVPEPEPLGGVLGGTFGAGPSADPGASTASDTQSEPSFDIAGGGFTTDAFTTGPAPADAGSAPFSLVPEEPGSSGALSGPVPAANPFDPAVGDTEPLGGSGSSSPFEASPFGGSPFGPVPGGDPFAPAGGAPLFGDPASEASAAGPAGAAAEPMSEEDYLRTQIQDAIMPVLHELVTELRRSLDFYRNRANGLGAEHVMITGGTAKLPGLTEFLSANLEAPVVIGNPLQYVSAGAKADPGYLQDVGPVFPVSVGLAIRELLVDTTPARKTKKR